MVADDAVMVVGVLIPFSALLGLRPIVGDTQTRGAIPRGMETTMLCRTERSFLDVARPCTSCTRESSETIQRTLEAVGPTWFIPQPATRGSSRCAVPRVQSPGPGVQRVQRDRGYSNLAIDT